MLLFIYLFILSEVTKIVQILHFDGFFNHLPALLCHLPLCFFPFLQLVNIAKAVTTEYIKLLVYATKKKE